MVRQQLIRRPVARVAPSINTEAFSVSATGTVPDPYTDNYTWTSAYGGNDSGNCTQSDGTNAFADTSVHSDTISDSDLGTFTLPPSFNGTGPITGYWVATDAESSGEATMLEWGNDTLGYGSEFIPGDGSSSSYQAGSPPVPAGIPPGGEYQIDAYDAWGSGDTIRKCHSQRHWASPRQRRPG